LERDSRPFAAAPEGSHSRRSESTLWKLERRGQQERSARKVVRAIEGFLKATGELRGSEIQRRLEKVAAFSFGKRRGRCEEA
jgi:hypothetical protein